MAVSSDQSRLSIQAGDSAEVDHDFQFKIFSKTDLKCWKESAAGVKTLGVVDVDYTVAFSASSESGTVTWAVAPVTGGRSIVDGSEMAFTQGTEFPRDTAIPNSTFRNAFDRACILAQQLSDVLFGRAILWNAELYLDDREQIEVSEAPVDRRALVYERNGDDDGWNIVPSDNDIDAVEDAVTASAAAALVSENNAAASAAAALASQNAAAASAAAALVSENNAETAETNAETAETNAAASAAAALVSENNAAASVALLAGTSGVKADRPAGGADRIYYYATDEEQEYMWSPLAAKWFVTG